MFIHTKNRDTIDECVEKAIRLSLSEKAAGERHTDGSIERSISVNREKLAISWQLNGILTNTAKALGFMDDEKE